MEGTFNPILLAKFTLLKFNYLSYPRYSRVYVAIKCYNTTNCLRFENVGTQNVTSNFGIQ